MKTGKYKHVNNCGRSTRTLRYESMEERVLLSNNNGDVLPDLTFEESDSIDVTQPSLVANSTDTQELIVRPESLESENATVTYNVQDCAKLRTFLNLDSMTAGLSNGAALNASYQADDPATWSGVVWTDVGGEARVTQISWNDCGLAGNLDLSDCLVIQEIECSDNALTAIVLTGCYSLEYLNCSSNSLTTLNVSFCNLLIDLNCSSNELASLVLSNCTLLENLDCSTNNLSELEVTDCIKLNSVSCYFNNLVDLDFSRCTALEHLDCYANQLNSLDVSTAVLLEELSCDNNELTQLNLLGCSSLQYLDCTNNKITNLDVSANLYLKHLFCWSTNLQKVNLADLHVNKTQIYLCSDLEDVWSWNNADGVLLATTTGSEDSYYIPPVLPLTVSNEDKTQTISFEITTLPSYHNNDFTKLQAFLNQLNPTTNLSNGKTLNYLYDPDSPLTWAGITWSSFNGLRRVTQITWKDAALSGSLNLGNCTQLEYLDCTYNTLSSLNLSNNESLTFCDCSNNQLTELNVSNCGSLKELYSSFNYLNTLDVSTCALIVTLDCSSNKLETLAFPENIHFQQLTCSSNLLTQLDLSGAVALKCLDCNTNNLTALVIKDCSSLEELNCSYNYLTTLDLSDNAMLWDLNCSGNRLTQLDVSANTRLVQLDCSVNSLVSLEMSNCVDIEVLYCHYNKLSTLHIPGHTKLRMLYCYSNSLNKINVRDCTALEYLDCSDNNMSHLDVSTNLLLEYLECWCSDIQFVTMANVHVNHIKINLFYGSESVWNWKDIDGNLLGTSAAADLSVYTPEFFPVMAINEAGTQIIKFVNTDEYVVSTCEGCSVYLSAANLMDTSPYDENAKYFWDLSGFPANGDNWRDKGPAFWTTVPELGFTPGYYTIRLKIQDAHGIFSDTVSATIHVLSTLPTINVKATDYVDGQVLLLSLDVFSPGTRTVQQWIINWGDGSEPSVLDCYSSFMNTFHYYDMPGNTTSYNITLNLIDTNGNGGDKTYYIGSHTIKVTNVSTAKHSETEDKSNEMFDLLKAPEVMSMPDNLCTSSIEQPDKLATLQNVSGNVFTMYTDAACTSGGLTGSYYKYFSLNEYDHYQDFRTTGVNYKTRTDNPATITGNTWGFSVNEWGDGTVTGITYRPTDKWSYFFVQWDGYIQLEQWAYLELYSNESSRMWIDLNHDNAFSDDNKEYVNNNWRYYNDETRHSSNLLFPGTYKIRIQYWVSYEEPFFYLKTNDSVQLDSPAGMVVNSKDQVIVANSNSDCVFVYNAQETSDFVFGGTGSANGYFNKPMDIAVDANDNYYVADCGNNRIQVFDSSGQFKFSFGTKGTAPGQFNSPEGIFYDKISNKIYVADTGNNRIQRFNKDGTPDRTFGTNGIVGSLDIKRDNTGFAEPSDISINPVDGTLWVADRMNSRLQVYNQSGTWLKTILSVYQPQAIVFDKSGNLYIAGRDENVQPGMNGRIRVLFAGDTFAQTNYFGGYDDIGAYTIRDSVEI